MTLKLLTVLGVSLFASLVILGCDEKPKLKSPGNGAAGNAGAASAPTDGASAEGDELKAILLVHEGTVAIEHGDVTTAQSKLSEAEKVRDKVSASRRETIDELSAKISAAIAAPAASQPAASPSR